MAILETVQARPSSPTPLTVSGARIEPITSDAVRMLVGKYGSVGETATVLKGVWGAFEHTKALIGIAYLIASPSSTGRGGVAVVPERRGLGVGSELMQLLVDEAGTQGMTALAYDHGAIDPGPPRLLRSLGLTAARRVHGGQARTIVIVPKPPLPNH